MVPWRDPDLDGDVDQADLDVTSRGFSGPTVAAKTWADGAPIDIRPDLAADRRL